ncbi:MAG: putative DNA binding domain-containing protein [Cyanobacteriota bacterium]|nr:putative DNA binding domain-containing protein [Cyanobacteriota bacterium]
MDLETLLEHIDIGEDQDIEFKSAENDLPKAIWETVSAFANTDGGYIILGVSEKNNQFIVSGVRNPEHLINQFWNNHNNSQKLNAPICSDSNLEIKEIESSKVLIIQIPRASRTQRPVYINNNPITGTYKRNYSGDYHCTEVEIKQMLRDASDDPQDYQILDGFDLNDLDPETLKTFRQRFTNREPDHPWLALDDQNLLSQLGGWRRDRNTNKEGLSNAGLLMFGRQRSILDAFPHYHLDYQERFSTDPEQRWDYRLTLDGKWEPNLFNFYYSVYSRLVNDLDVPFRLDKNAIRAGETHVHQAIREALVNALIHANHLSTKSLVIIKFQQGFAFSNPGRLRISLKSLYEGGDSDVRNPNLQKMFQMLGLGEKAGSGFGKILRAWREQQWVIPRVLEKLDLEVTSVVLPMVSFIPENIEKELKEIVGDNYHSLTELERIILVITHKFGEVSNTDIQHYRKEHPTDIGRCLKRLVDNGCLEKSGIGKGTRYNLPNQDTIDLFSLLTSSEHSESNSDHNEPNPEHNESNSEHKESNSEHNQKQLLMDIAAPVREKKRAKPELMRTTILNLCSNKYINLKTLAELLDRSPDTIRTHYLNPMLEEGSLELQYPNQPSHPQQAYKTVSKQNNNKAQTF